MYLDLADMRRRTLLVGAGSLATTAIAGCSANLDGTPDEAATPAKPAEGPVQVEVTTTDAENERVIVVSSTGEAMGEPNLAVLQLAVEVTGDRAGDVRDELARRSEQLRSELLAYGLDEEALTTEHFRIHERVDRRQMEEDGVRPDAPEQIEEYRYYVGTHAFRVEVEDIDEVGAVIDAGVDGGADEVGRVSFTLSDEREADLRDEAIRTALRQARDEAETIADEIGATVVEATVVDASDGRVSPVHREAAFGGDAAMTPAPTTGVEPGEVTVTATVHVRYWMA